MGLDKKMLKKTFGKPNHIAHLMNLKSYSYDVVARLKATAIKSDEPIRFEDID
jgi:hypothetical protein